MRSKYEKALNDFLKSVKAKFWHEPCKIPYTIPAKKANYIPDFVIYKGQLKKVTKPKDVGDLKDCIVIEAKGWFKPADRGKMLLVKKANPDLDIRMLFQANGFVYSSKKRRSKDSTNMRYGDWCDKYGFPWAIGKEVPKEWLDDNTSNK